MSLIPDDYAAVRRTLDAVIRLEANEDFKAIMVPHFKELEEEHAKACRDRELTMEKRAEHIEAAAMAEELQKYLTERRKGLESALERLKRQKT